MALFLERRIGYLEITELIRACMEEHVNIPSPTLEEILDTEAGVYAYIDSRLGRR